MSETLDALRPTPLHAKHLARGAKMGGFAGYAMPIQYGEGVLKEHLWTRQSASLFDVSHMGPALVMVNSASGDAEADHRAISALVEPLICADVAGLKPGKLRYSLLLNDDGGIDDDLIIGRVPEAPGVLFLVVNAAGKAQDLARFAAAVGDKGSVKPFPGWSLLALQGPKAAEVLGEVIPGVAGLGFMETGRFAAPGGGIMIISRCGYTGEDGFEILLWPGPAEQFWDGMLTDPRVRPAGLGARDSLRLEAGLPLYGHDLDAAVTPVEADLAFAISPRRKAAADFPGAVNILQDLERGPERLRIGLLVDGAPAREGAVITDADGQPIGTVTSGGPSPTLGKPIAMGFVPSKFAQPGTRLGVIVRERVQKAAVTPLPFVPHRYIRKI